jgi:outer membrane protein TolC
VKASEYELASANARVGITKASMYPALNITAAGGLNSFKSDNWFNMPASLFGMVAGSVTQPLLQRKQLRTQYEIAKVEREKAVIAFRQSVLNAVGEVSDALVKVEKLKQEQEFAADRVANLQKATTNADMLFKSGMANYLEVITAQSNVLQSELDLAALKRDQLNAVAQLYRSLGGGWR